MNRAAILFSGFARTYKETYQCFFEKFINCNKNWDIDIYIALQPFSQEKNNFKERDQVDLDDVLLKYKPTSFKVYECSKDEINKKYEILKPFFNFPASHWSKKDPNFAKATILSQFYGWAEVIKELKNIKYDLIIKNRFDVLPENNIYLDEINPDKFTHFKRFGRDHFGCDDMVFASNQKNMMKIMNIYNEFLNEENLTNIPCAFPEWLLYEYVKNDLKIKLVYGPQLKQIFR